MKFKEFFTRKPVLFFVKQVLVAKQHQDIAIRRSVARVLAPVTQWVGELKWTENGNFLHKDFWFVWIVWNFGYTCSIFEYVLWELVYTSGFMGQVCIYMCVYYTIQWILIVFTSQAVQLRKYGFRSKEIIELDRGVSNFFGEIRNPQIIPWTS